MSTLFDDLFGPNGPAQSAPEPTSSGRASGVTDRGVPTWAEAAAQGGHAGADPAQRHTAELVGNLP